MTNTSHHYRLELADGTDWILTFAPDIMTWGKRLAHILRLKDSPPNGQPEIRFYGVEKTETHDWMDESCLTYNFKSLRIYKQEPDPDLFCAVDNSGHDKDIEIVNMWFSLSPVYARSMLCGGLPFHAVLVERDGKGILLAAPGDTGKSTCAQRIPPPWKAISDDEALIVRDPQGCYRVHPFPTWSQFIWGRVSSSTWDVQSSVPLTAIFFFYQAETDSYEPLQQGQTAGLINDAANQTCRRIWRRMHGQRYQEFTTRIFLNACDMAKVVPAFRLGISLNGRFWEEIEQALAIGDWQRR